MLNMLPCGRQVVAYLSVGGLESNTIVLAYICLMLGYTIFLLAHQQPESCPLPAQTPPRTCPDVDERDFAINSKSKED